VVLIITINQHNHIKQDTQKYILLDVLILVVVFVHKLSGLVLGSFYYFVWQQSAGAYHRVEPQKGASLG
jgi:hypothetical protein